ncbi:hypothetical protein ACIRRA_29965 [Nocardia sp. NPDC101769]
MRKLRSNPATRVFNRMMSARARRNRGRVMGMNVLVLHTTRRRQTGSFR